MRLKLASAAHLWPYLLVAGASLVLFWELIFAGRAMFWGTPMLQFHPWRSYAFEVLRAGHLPLWNPYLGMGSPLVANYQSAIFYPPNWLFFVLPVDLGLGWIAVGHVIFAGAGMIRLARRIGLGELGQAVAGLCFALSGYLVARLGFITINNAVAWLPWLVLAADQLAIERRAQNVLRLALPLIMQLLAGHAQTSWYSILITVAWFIWRHATDRSRPGPHQPREWLRALAALAGALGLAVCASAIQLLPTFELLRLSSRAAAVDYEFVTTYSFWPWRIATLIAPDLFGNPAHGDYWGYGNYWEDAVYFGILPLFFVVWALTQKKIGAKSNLASPPHPCPAPPLARVPASPYPFLLSLMAASLLLALGKFTPAFPLFYRYVPSFNLFQAPARMMIGFVFAAALLAGMGAERWRKPGGKSLYWLRLGTAGAVAVMLTAVTGSLALDVKATFLRSVAMAGGWMIGAGALMLLKPKGDSRAWSVAVGAFIAADLMAAGWGLNPTLDPRVYRQSSEAIRKVQAAAGDHRVYHPKDDEYAIKFKQFFRFESFLSDDDWAGVGEALLPNSAQARGLRSANNFEPLLPSRYERWMELVHAARPEQAARLLKLMDVRVEVVAGEAASGNAIHSAGGFTVVDLGNSAERVRVLTEAWRVADADAALQAVASPEFDPEQTIVIEPEDDSGGPLGWAAPFVPGWGEEGTPASASDELTLNPGVVRIPVSLSEPGYLLLSDQYYPGWQAYVDGRPVPILRADYFFRAVRLPAGEHSVEFHYRPLSFFLGTLISAMAWLAMGAAGIWMKGAKVREQIQGGSLSGPA